MLPVLIACACILCSCVGSSSGCIPCPGRFETTMVPGAQSSASCGKPAVQRARHRQCAIHASSSCPGIGHTPTNCLLLQRPVIQLPPTHPCLWLFLHGCVHNDLPAELAYMHSVTGQALAPLTCCLVQLGLLAAVCQPGYGIQDNECRVCPFNTYK